MCEMQSYCEDKPHHNNSKKWQPEVRPENSNDNEDD